MILDRKRPVMVRSQENLLRDPNRMLSLSVYTTIDANMTQGEGFRGLALTVRKGTGLSLSELKSIATLLQEQLKD